MVGKKKYDPNKHLNKKKRAEHGRHYGGVEHSLEWEKQYNKQRRAEERSWKSKNGPVIVTNIKDREQTQADD